MIKVDNVLPEDLSFYIESFSESEPIFLKEQRLEAEKDIHGAKMISGAYQGRLLSLISKMKNPKTILELGTYTGYATQCLAEGLREDGVIYTLERNIELKPIIDKNLEKSKYKNQIKVIFEDAKKFVENTEQLFDLVFLDANKKQYLNYYHLLLPKLNKGGVILADNILWKGKVLNDNGLFEDKMAMALHQFNEFVKTDQRVEVVMLPLRDGLSMIRKK